jgi:glycine cleavage system H protein
MDPKSLRYSKEHEWLAVDGDAGTVGISDHAQSELGDIVFVEFPDVGREVKAGEVVGTIESVKAVSELYTPVSGKIVEVNDALEDKPETVNQDPYGDGWLIKIALSDPSEVEDMMDHEAYAAFTD